MIAYELRDLKDARLFSGDSLGSEEQILFSDEKIFTVEEVTNSQNDRILSKRSRDIPEKLKNIDKVHKPLSVMVWSGVSAESRTHLIFVPTRRLTKN